MWKMYKKIIVRANQLLARENDEICFCRIEVKLRDIPIKYQIYH